MCSWKAGGMTVRTATRHWSQRHLQVLLTLQDANRAAGTWVPIHTPAADLGQVTQLPEPQGFPQWEQQGLPRWAGEREAHRGAAEGWGQGEPSALAGLSLSPHQVPVTSVGGEQGRRPSSLCRCSTIPPKVQRPFSHMRISTFKGPSSGKEKGYNASGP